MKITLVLVSSVNGKITRGNDPNIYTWTSKEDQEQFFSLIQKNSLIIMGRKTYEAARAKIKLVPGKLRVVMTNNPDKYVSERVPGQLEFTQEKPRDLIARLQKDGYTEALVVGGSAVASSFFQSKLIDTVLLTIEPYLFGSGTSFLGDHLWDVKLKLHTAQRLNVQGTMLLEYTVV